MPKKPKNEAVRPDSEVKNADGDKVVRPVVTAETDSNAEVRVRLFKEAAQAVHVTPMEKGWQVYRVGTEPKEFGEKSLAIEFAEHDAKKYKVPALLHESGHAIKLTDWDPVAGNVFLNCPFDDQYDPIFKAVVFAVHACGFTLRCAKESSGTESVRIEKIITMIRECEFGIHDLSRVDTLGKLPRFNMALELGIFIGARSFGGKPQKGKKFFVLEGRSKQYHQTLSDISGQDPGCHNNTPEEAVKEVRKWLSDQVGTKPGVPGKDRIMLLYGQFRALLPGLLDVSGQDEGSMTFRELRECVQQFLDAQVPSPASS